MIDHIVALLNGWSGFEFSIHGWLAIIGGIIGVAACNGGLMYLVIRSHRNGHDDSVADYQRPDRRP